MCHGIILTIASLAFSISPPLNNYKLLPRQLSNSMNAPNTKNPGIRNSLASANHASIFLPDPSSATGPLAHTTVTELSQLSRPVVTSPIPTSAVHTELLDLTRVTQKNPKHNSPTFRFHYWGAFFSKRINRIYPDHLEPFHITKGLIVSIENELLTR